MPKIITAAPHRFLWGAILLFAALPLLAFPELIFGGQTLYQGDISLMHYPGRIFLAEEWLAGRIPLWDPYRQAGAPMLADPQIGVLYPLSLIFLSPLEPALELTLFTLIHFTLAALFTFMLGRSVRLSRPAATLAGLAFGFGGVLMAQVPNQNIMTTVVWLPLLLWAALQAMRRRSWPAAMLAGSVVAMQILAGHFQIIFYSLATVSGLGLYKIGVDFFFGTPSRRGNLRYAGQTGWLFSLMILSGLLLGAPQLLPTLEMLPLTGRSIDRGLDLLTENSLPPVMGLNLLLPSIFGNNVTGFKGGDPFQEDFMYAGFLPLLLIFFSGRQRRPYLVFFWLLLGGSIGLALGKFTPLYAYVIQYLPGFNLFRIPARWLMVINLSLAMLAGFGLDGLLKTGLSRRRLAGLLGGGLLLGGGVGLLWLFQAEVDFWAAVWLSEFHHRLLVDFLARGYTVQPVYHSRLLLGWLPWLTAPAWLLLTNLLIAVGLLSLLAFRRISPGTFAGLVIGVVALDLVAAGGTTLNPLQPTSFWQRQSGGAAYILKRLPPNERVFPLGANNEELAVSHLGTYYPSVERVLSANGYASPLRLARYVDFLDAAHPVQGVQILGVRYLLTQGLMSRDVAATFPIVYQDDSSVVYENQKPLPRAFVVHRAVVENDPEAALAHFKDLTLDPRQTVVLESPTPAPPPEPAGEPAQIEITVAQPQTVEIQATLAGAGYLVVLDTYYPGWVATLDGQATPIYRANYLAQAVFVPAGRHVIRFQYRPLAFRLGLGLALLVFTLFSASLVWRRRRAHVKSD